MRIVGLNFNPSEAAGLRWHSFHQAAIGRSLERLATGKQINHASDNPAGAIAAENLKAEQQTVLAQISRNQQTGYRYAAVDGGLWAVEDLLTELKGSVIAAANTGGLSDAERAAYQLNADSIVETLAHLAVAVTFKGEQILAGYVGASATHSGGSVAGSLAALKSGGTLNLVSGDLKRAEDLVTGVLSSITSARAGTGAAQKSLDAENRALQSRNENLSAAISQIVDTDYASEVGALIRSQALAEAAAFATQLSQRLQADLVLSLIRNQPKIAPLSAQRD